MTLLSLERASTKLLASYHHYYEALECGYHEMPFSPRNPSALEDVNFLPPQGGKTLTLVHFLDFLSASRKVDPTTKYCGCKPGYLLEPSNTILEI